MKKMKEMRMWRRKEIEWGRGTEWMEMKKKRESTKKRETIPAAPAAKAPPFPSKGAPVDDEESKDLLDFGGDHSTTSSSRVDALRLSRTSTRVASACRATLVKAS